MSTSSALWNPFATMGPVSDDRFVIDRAEGVWVWDEDGRRYLDGTASLWYANIGHGRAEIAEAVAAQLRHLDAFSIFGDYANRPAMDLADRLAALAPWPDARVFLGSGGGDAIETAAKLARAHFTIAGQPERVHLIARDSGYHGTHGYGTSIGGISANTTGWGPTHSAISVVPNDRAEALEAEILRIGPDRVAAFFCEPVIGAGGVIAPMPGYLEAVDAVCLRYGVLFIADCVICAFGRLGTWLGIDRWQVTPDMVTLAKGLTAGYQPLGALLVSPRVAAPYFDEAPGSPVLRHGPTYAGHPACCAAALAVLDIYEREDLIVRGRELEASLERALAPLREHPLIGDVRAGLGLLAGMDLAPEVLAAMPDAPTRWRDGCRAAGLLTRPLGAGIAVSPPLIVTEGEIEQLGTAVGEGLGAVEHALAERAPIL
jgi:adenosylmethionine-8-amino-7-oxononanoate aminotransferase